MVTENRQSLCGSNVRWKTVPESTASSGQTVTSLVVGMMTSSDDDDRRRVQLSYTTDALSEVTRCQAMKAPVECHCQLVSNSLR